MDWVEKRAQQDELLRQGGDRIWEYFRMAICQSAKSYAHHYGNKKATRLECHVDKPDLVYVDYSPSLNDESSGPAVAIIVTRDVFKRHAIDVTYRHVTIPQKTLTIAVTSDGSVALTNNGSAISEDEAARLILEPIFFPATAKSVKA